MELLITFFENLGMLPSAPWHRAAIEQLAKKPLLPRINDLPAGISLCEDPTVSAKYQPVIS